MAAVEMRMDGIESRMDRLDGRMDRPDGRMERVETRLGALEQKVSEINGKLDILVCQVVARLPSGWQMPVVIGSTVVLLGALLAAPQKLHLAGL
jgi:tetrahydromethanopterin S-methyltransferase subunit G